MSTRPAQRLIVVGVEAAAVVLVAAAVVAAVAVEEEAVVAAEVDTKKTAFIIYCRVFSANPANIWQ